MQKPLSFEGEGLFTVRYVAEAFSCRHLSSFTPANTSQKITIAQFKRPKSAVNIKAPRPSI